MDERTNNPTALVAAAAHGPLGPTHTPIKEHRTFTCLLVEDDDAVRILVANYLEENDVRVICASRLCDVAPLLARNQPDLIVLDLQLGREDGLDLLREAARDPIYPSSLRPGTGPTKSTESSGWSSELTTTSPSHLAWGNCWPASAPSCDAGTPDRQNRSARAKEAAFASGGGASSGGHAASPIREANRSPSPRANMLC
ncbi:CheY-like chemotaxis protein [Bradyrhizobium barranii subsp. barranii]